MYPRIAQLRTVAGLQKRLQELGQELPADEQLLSAEQGSPLASPLPLGTLRAGNRWCIHPMEGWDANPDGSPSELTLRRWRHFGQSGAKLIWGGEAAAVQPDGRANPRQTLATEDNRAGLKQLIDTLREAHHEAYSTTEDLVVGLQLTHSGRFSRPHSKQLEPRIAYHHPLLDAKFGIAPDDDSVVWTDEQLHELIERYVAAAQLAAEVGFQFVDVKVCHGYLLHEFLSARNRPGEFGGDFAGRTRLLLTIIRRIQQTCPGLEIGVRLSGFDTVPYRPGAEVGEPQAYELPYQEGFGCDPADPLAIHLDEPIRLLRTLHEAGVVAVNLTAGSPYYNPHIQRPALFPPSDGYQPPEDPLISCCRQIQTARRLKEAVPELVMVGTGYTYLQEFVPQVAQAVVRAGWIDAVGLGRMVLSYPRLPADTLAGTPPVRKLICRTFSDCTTGPRNGLISGCYPLDAYYKKLPEAEELKQFKQALKL